jgi:hypothetical protein
MPSATAVLRAFAAPAAAVNPAATAYALMPDSVSCASLGLPRVASAVLAMWLALKPASASWSSYLQRHKQQGSMPQGVSRVQGGGGAWCSEAQCNFRTTWPTHAVKQLTCYSKHHNTHLPWSMNLSGSVIGLNLRPPTSSPSNTKHSDNTSTS